LDARGRQSIAGSAEFWNESSVDRSEDEAHDRSHPFSKEHAEGKREMKQAKPPPGHTVLKIGDRVRLVSGTLTWSAEMTLQGKIGDVIECSDDGAATKRVTVRFPNGRLLTSRNVGMFEIV
jgi:hypothetical protein